MMKKQTPTNWVEVKFQDVADVTDFVANGSFEALRLNVVQTDEPDYAILIRLKDFSNNWRGPFKYVTKESYEFLSKSSLREGDLVISNVGEPGKLFIVPDLSKPMTLGPNGVRIRATGATSNRFLAYYYQSPQGRGVIDSLITGTAQLKFNKTEFRNSRVLIPPISEQALIIDKLDTIFSHLNSIGKELETLSKALKKSREALITHAVTGDIKNYTTLGTFDITIQTGPFGSALHKEDYIENGVPVINPSHIKNGKLTPSFLVTVDKKKAKELETWLLNENDVILGRRGEMGRAAVYYKKLGAMLCGTGSLILRSSEDISPKFLMYYLRSSFCVKYLTENSVGSTMVNLNQTILKSLPFPKLSKIDQELVVENIDMIYKRIDLLDEQYNTVKQLIDKIPQAILSKAFQGKLASFDTDSGSALELTKSISTERVKTSNANVKQSKPTKKMKAKIVNHSLLVSLKLNSEKKEFTFDEIRELSSVSYAQLKDDLFSLLDSKVLEMVFDEANELMVYKLANNEAS